LNISELIPKPSVTSSAVNPDIDFLITRTEKTDRTMYSDVQQLERKIQQLITLSKEVSLTQYQLEQYRDEVRMLREDVIHASTRLEEIVANLENHHEHDLEHIEISIDESCKHNSKTFRSIDDRLNELEAHKQRWANRAKGAWAVFALVAFILQYIGMQYVRSEEHTSELQSQYAI
jgi:signal transduction histidine kinase